MARRPNIEDPRLREIDAHVGKRIKLRRVVKGISQERLAYMIDVSYQQVQKYERAINRVGASRLHEIAEALETTVGFFFEDLPGVAAEAEDANAQTQHWICRELANFVATEEGRELNEAFASLKDIRQRKRLVELVRSLGLKPVPSREAEAAQDMPQIAAA